MKKRWLFAQYVWVQTGKPRPRSVYGTQWTRRLLFLDGIGGLYYINEIQVSIRAVFTTEIHHVSTTRT